MTRTNQSETAELWGRAKRALERDYGLEGAAAWMEAGAHQARAKLRRIAFDAKVNKPFHMEQPERFRQGIG
jgi:hypothetical protein